jgi:hypothetical protein
MDLHTARRWIVENAYAERGRLLTSTVPNGKHRAQRARAAEAQRLVRECGVIPFRPDRWLGRALAPAEAKTIVAALEQLTHFCEPIRAKRRVTHLKLLGVVTFPPPPEVKS